MAAKGLVCPSCGKNARPTTLRFQGHDVRGWRCSCSEVIFHPEDAQRILLLNKVKARTYEVKVGQIRSNLILRIPKEMADALELRKGEVVRMKAGKGRKMTVQA